MDSGLSLTYTRHPDETLHLHRNVQQDLHHTALCNGFLSAADSAVVRKTDAEYKSTTQKFRSLTRVRAGRNPTNHPDNYNLHPYILTLITRDIFNLPATDTLKNATISGPLTPSHLLPAKTHHHVFEIHLNAVPRQDIATQQTVYGFHAYPAQHLVDVGKTHRHNLIVSDHQITEFQ